MNFDKDSKSKFFVVGGGGGGGRGGGAETITVCQNQNVKCGKIRKSNHIHTVEHGSTVNFSKYVNYILGIKNNSYFELSCNFNFDKESKSDF